MKFNIPSVDPMKFYTFYVRSKISLDCGSTNLWSELSGPVFWGRKTTEGTDGLSWRAPPQGGHQHNPHPKRHCYTQGGKTR